MTPHSRASRATPESCPDAGLFADCVVGARAIAVALYGDSRRARAVYHLARGSRLPIFRLGGQLAIRRSDVALWIEHQVRGQR